MSLYYDDLLNDRPGAFADFFPTKARELENRLLTVNLSPERPFCSYCCNTIPSKDVGGGFGAPSYCFPTYTYSEDGSERRENVTLQTLKLFRLCYDENSITPADIFHYVYAVLHHSTYRTRYAANLKRELPRIPFVGIIASAKANAPASFFPLAAIEAMQGGAKPSHNPKVSATLFHAFANAGRKLVDLHVNYESAIEFPLERQECKEVKLDWRVETMKLSKDKKTLFYNDFLTLIGIPLETYHYRLGNRSALEWVIDQYRVTRDENGNIVSDPNRLDDERYIVKLVEQVITVSVETVRIINNLPPVETAHTASDA
jgi:predicted helicase